MFVINQLFAQIIVTEMEFVAMVFVIVTRDFWDRIAVQNALKVHATVMELALMGLVHVIKDISEIVANS